MHPRSSSARTRSPRSRTWAAAARGCRSPARFGVWAGSSCSSPSRTRFSRPATPPSTWSPALGSRWAASGVFPRVLDRTHPRWRSPYIAVIAQFVIGLPLALWLRDVYGPVKGFVLMATIITAVMIAIYIAVDLSCLVYYWRHQRQDFNLLLHAIPPVVGIIFFLPALLASVGFGQQLFRFIKPLTYPATLAGIVD